VRPQVPGLARRAGEAAAERRRPQVRARDIERDGLWVPVRLPGAAAHGDRPGEQAQRALGGEKGGGSLDTSKKRILGRCVCGMLQAIDSPTRLSERRSRVPDPDKSS
jgi:hypothetical protein